MRRCAHSHADIEGGIHRPDCRCSSPSGVHRIPDIIPACKSLHNAFSLNCSSVEKATGPCHTGGSGRHAAGPSRRDAGGAVQGQHCAQVAIKKYIQVFAYSSRPNVKYQHHTVLYMRRRQVQPHGCMHACMTVRMRGGPDCRASIKWATNLRMPEVGGREVEVLLGFGTGTPLCGNGLRRPMPRWF